MTMSENAGFRRAAVRLGTGLALVLTLVGGTAVVTPETASAATPLRCRDMWRQAFVYDMIATRLFANGQTDLAQTYRNMATAMDDWAAEECASD